MATGMADVEHAAGLTGHPMTRTCRDGAALLGRIVMFPVLGELPLKEM